MFREAAIVFSHICGVYGLVIFSIFGFVFIDRKVFRYCIYLMMLTMIYNTILKNIFQIPLPATCPTTGYGFPSGHSHFVSIFYIWLILHYKNNILRTVCLLMMICFYCTMVYLGYHRILEVCAAGVFALVSVVLYNRFVTSSDDFYRISVFTIILAIFLASETQTLMMPQIAMIPVAMLILFYVLLSWMAVFRKEGYIILSIFIIYALLLRSPIIALQPHIYIAFYFITGLFCAEICTKHEDPGSWTSKIISILLIAVCWSGLRLLFGGVKCGFPIINQFIWFCLAFSVPVCVMVSNVCCRYFARK